MDYGQLAARARALADPVRVQVVALLGGQPPPGMCVAELQEQLGLGQSRTSYHVAELRQAGLVQVQVQGRQRFYALQPEALEAMAAALVELARPGFSGPPAGRPARHLPARDLPARDLPARDRSPAAPRLLPSDKPSWLL